MSLLRSAAFCRRVKELSSGRRSFQSFIPLPRVSKSYYLVPRKERSFTNLFKKYSSVCCKRMQGKQIYIQFTSSTEMSLPFPLSLSIVNGVDYHIYPPSTAQRPVGLL